MIGNSQELGAAQYALVHVHFTKPPEKVGEVFKFFDVLRCDIVQIFHICFIIVKPVIVRIYWSAGNSSKEFVVQIFLLFR